ncbi:hypothetical protein MAR_013326 [Mya arenaria]|uniref:Uncharacterized protein n=1 Tax=Mya arenaria TaxID=6604 RepID=A0ABY7FZK5_MYAAR|nr:hypothetical protein MAR_013326 [Mya arenaria]
MCNTRYARSTRNSLWTQSVTTSRTTSRSFEPSSKARDRKVLSFNLLLMLVVVVLVVIVTVVWFGSAAKLRKIHYVNDHSDTALPPSFGKSTTDLALPPIFGKSTTSMITVVRLCHQASEHLLVISVIELCCKAFETDTVPYANPEEDAGNHGDCHEERSEQEGVQLLKEFFPRVHTRVFGVSSRIHWNYFVSISCTPEPVERTLFVTEGAHQLRLNDRVENGNDTETKQDDDKHDKEGNFNGIVR